MARYPVTIIIPLFCPTQMHILWAKECIDSALATGAHVVVYDDGSPENLRQLKGRYGTSLIWDGNRRNHGPAFARNRAAELAFTELIFPLDCDDVVKPEAITRLYDEWQKRPGEPLYPDIYKFGEVNDQHFKLLTWSCELQKKKLGISSVCVLHEKSQWEAIGGWNELFKRTNLYEDSDYNIRLFYKYCARALHEPLVGYRQHGAQRTHDKVNAAAQARKMVAQLWRYDEMARGCCGKGKRAPSNAPAQPQMTGGYNMLNMTFNASQLETNLPGSQGDKVLARYTGGEGKGKHYYRGKGSNWPYKVQYGGLFYVDPRDAKNEGDVNNPSKFILIKFEESEPEPEPVMARNPRANAPSRVPEEDIVLDITSLNVSEVEGMQFTSKEAEMLLKVEKRNKNRTGVKKHLSKFVG